MSYGETRLGQGRENVRNFLRENPTLAAEIDAAVRQKAASQAIAPLRTSAVERNGDSQIPAVVAAVDEDP
jgi:recombination protein RecA